MANLQSYDAIVIGAGQGGGPLAGRLAESGRKVALIERSHVGGTCVNVGCTPTKTMIASARVAYLARRAADYGVEVGAVSINQKTVRERKRGIVEQFRSGSRKSIEKKESLDLIEGHASFTAPKNLNVELPDGGTRQLHSEQIFINTGAKPFIPPVDGLDDVDYLDSTSIMELGETPEHLVIIGGGYVGLEFGQMFRRFGSEVTIIEQSSQLLAREDDDIAEAVAEILKDDGIDVRLNASASRVANDDRGFELFTESKDGDEHSITGTHLLVAAGRRPNSEALNVAAAGIERDDQGYITVNNRLETNVPGVHALGDVTGGPPFTHISYDDYRILSANLLNDGDRTTDNRPIPYTVFIDPQLGRVGLTEDQAREQGYNIGVAKQPMERVARALEVDETRGLMKAVVDLNTKQILGAAILGIDGGEVASAVQFAMMGEVPYTALRDAPISHPTVTESLNNLFSSID